jgi:putative CocE/NonD family hydrolase
LTGEHNMRFKAVLLSFFVLVASALSSIAQQRDTPADLAKYIRENYTKMEVMVPMRDGVRLFTSIYLPKNVSEKYPILLSRTPYSVAPYGKDAQGNDEFKTSLGPSVLFARQGYIFAYQDVRGRWRSEGTFMDVRPVMASKNSGTDESTDAYDTIDWLVKNVPNNNGKVGMYGISYPGFYTSAGSVNSHPALKACSPQAPVSDWFHGDDMHHNGALFLAQNYFFYTFFQPFASPTSDAKVAIKEWRGRDTQDGYDYFLKLGGLKETANSFVKGLGTRQPYWDALMDHPNYDQFWKDRNVLDKLTGIKCATMTVGGYFDDEDAFGAQKTYQHIETQDPGIYNILVLGPWFHGGWERSEGDWLGTAYFGQKNSFWYQEKMELPFFDHFLKDKGDISNFAEVTVFDTGTNQWKGLESWNPTVNVTDERLYLQPGGKLVLDNAGSQLKSGVDEYVSDPMKPVPYTQKITQSYPREFMTEDQRFASTRPDVLVYETDPLTEDMTMAGDMHPEIWVSSSGTDSDFVVKLIDVFPDDYKYPDGVKPPANWISSVFEPGGYQMLLRGEPFPARFRNSFEKPEPLKPGEAVKLRWEMPGIVHTFKKGHRIMVQVQSTWFPLVARNPQQFLENYQKADQSAFRKATERVYMGGKTPSSIVLRIQK